MLAEQDSLKRYSSLFTRLNGVREGGLGGIEKKVYLDWQ